MEKLFIIGFGPGDEAWLSDKAKDILRSTKRILNTREISLKALLKVLREETGETAVLVSGDSGFFSVTQTLIKDFSDLYEIEVLPGIGSIPYFSAKLKIPYDNTELISLHGRSSNIISKVVYNKKVFALTGGVNSASEICQTLCRCGLGNTTVYIGERLSCPDERIVQGKAADFENEDFDSLSVMYIENHEAVNPHLPLHDKDFIRSNVPMTKEEVRWIAIQKLGIFPSDVIFDIGAGTGSVSIEMARKAYDGFVYAIEVNEDACDLIWENMAKHGTFNIEIVHGKAPDSLEGLPVPDCVFVGGSSGSMGAILAKLLSLNPNVKVTATAITLQTLHQISDSFERYGISEIEIICVNVAKAKKVGTYDMMMAQNPVYIISGFGSDSCPGSEHRFGALEVNNRELGGNGDG